MREQVIPGIFISVEQCDAGLWHGTVEFEYSGEAMHSPGHWLTADEAMTNARAVADQARAARRELG